MLVSGNNKKRASGKPGVLLVYRRGDCMPVKPQKPCRYPGCKHLTSELYCTEHVHEKKDTKRGTAAQRGYGYRWNKYRRSYLIDHPFCRECELHATITLATVVDHIIPHKGSYALFWDTNNHQPLCKRHHDIKTQREDGGWWDSKKGLW